jgi:hypothetical protein
MASSKPGVLGAEAKNQSIEPRTLARTNTPLPSPILHKNVGRKCPWSSIENATISGLNRILRYTVHR